MKAGNVAVTTPSSLRKQGPRNAVATLILDFWAASEIPGVRSARNDMSDNLKPKPSCNMGVSGSLILMGGQGLKKPPPTGLVYLNTLATISCALF